MSNSYRDLIVWQKALALVSDVYEWTEPFPGCERYGLTSQMRRAVISVVNNIAEGQGRNTRGEFVQFLGTAKGSLIELETDLFVAANLRYITTRLRDHALAKTDEVSRLINGLKQSLESPAKLAEHATRN